MSLDGAACDSRARVADRRRIPMRSGRRVADGPCGAGAAEILEDSEAGANEHAVRLPRRRRARVIPRSSPFAAAAVSQAADVIVYDHRVHAGLLRMARPDAERIDVGAAAPKPLDQDAICFLLAEKAREGKTVARLKWGDPFVFDSGGKEALFLHEQGIPFEVVPGIPAAIGGLAYAGVPITYPDGGDVVVFIRGHEDETDTPADVDWPALARLHGTLVCYAGARQIAAMTKALVAHGRSEDESAALIYDGTLPSQRTVQGTLGTIAERDRERRRGAARRRLGRRAARAPALVRRPSAVRQAHRRDAIARAGGRARRDARGSRRRSDPGADDPDRCRPRIWTRSTARAPTPARSTGSSSRAPTRSITSWSGCSRSATSAISRACASARSEPSTAARLGAVRHSHRPHAVGVPQRSAGRGRSVSWGRSTASRFLLPRADIGRELLADELRDAGAEVIEVVAYRTVIGGAEREEADIYRMLLDRQIDAITFTSASTVRNFASILGPDQAADLLRTTVVACIGPVTAEAAQQLDIATTVMPERYTIPDLVDALVEHFGKK